MVKKTASNTMSTLTRFGNAGASQTGLDVVTTLDAIEQKSKAAPNQLIAVFFNIQSPERGSVESRLKNFRFTYEKKVLFYKCVVTKRPQEIQMKLNVEDAPAFVFFLNGDEVGRITDLDESNPNIAVDPAALGEESKDEKKVKAKLNELCETYKEKLSN